MTLSVLARAGVLDEALVDEAGSLSYAELAARVRTRLGELRAAGLDEGARVAIVGEATRGRSGAAGAGSGATATTGPPRGGTYGNARRTGWPRPARPRR